MLFTAHRGDPLINNRWFRYLPERSKRRWATKLALRVLRTVAETLPEVLAETVDRLELKNPTRTVVGQRAPVRRASVRRIGARTNVRK